MEYIEYEPVYDDRAQIPTALYNIDVSLRGIRESIGCISMFIELIQTQGVNTYEQNTKKGKK